MRIVPAPAIPRKLDRRLLAVQLWGPQRPHDLCEVSVSGIRASYSVFPAALESVFALGADRLVSNLGWWEAEWANRTHLEPLLDPDVPLRPMARLLLAVGLAAKAPGEHGLATDACIAAIADGRLDGERLGTTLADLLPTGLIKAARWAKRLGDVARVSPLHTEVIRQAVARSLRGDLKKSPKDLHALIELLKELVAETHSAVDTDARALLAKITGSTKLAKAAKAILACDSAADGERIGAIQRAVVEQRLARVERWVSRKTGRHD